MRRRQWSSQEKFKIVLEGLSSHGDIRDLWTKNGISRTQFHRWRDQFMKFGPQAFERQKSLEEQRLREENKKLKQKLKEVIEELEKMDFGSTG